MHFKVISRGISGLVLDLNNGEESLTVMVKSVLVSVFIETAVRRYREISLPPLLHVFIF